MRPKTYTKDTVVCVRPDGQSTLKKHSDRREIVNMLIERGGCATMGEIDEHFGYSVRQKVLALTRSGWLGVSE